MIFLDDFKVGQVLGASDLNKIKAELIRLGKVTAAPPLHVSDDSSGFYFDLAEAETFAIKITSAGTGSAAGSYAWTEQTPISGGGWANGVRSGTLSADPAFEANLNASIGAGTIILRAWREPVTNELRFERSSWLMGMLPENYYPRETFGRLGPSGQLVLDAAAAGELNAILAELRRLDKTSVASPLEYSSDSSGRRWGLDRPGSLYVQLSGSSNPYSWSEAYRTPGGGSSLVTGGQTGMAYEANGLAGLASLYATIDQTIAGDWRFQIARQATSSGDGGVICPTIYPCGWDAETIPETINLAPLGGGGALSLELTYYVEFTAGSVQCIGFNWLSPIIPSGYFYVQFIVRQNMEAIVNTYYDPEGTMLYSVAGCTSLFTSDQGVIPCVDPQSYPSRCGTYSFG